MSNILYSWFIVPECRLVREKLAKQFLDQIRLPKFGEHIERPLVLGCVGVLSNV